MRAGASFVRTALPLDLPPENKRHDNPKSHQGAPACAGR
jgi:hypothetical protein